MRVDRRTLLVAGGAGAGLVIAFALWPRGTASLLDTEPGEEAFNQYLKIGTDGRVRIVLPQAETGQGSWTGLAQILADELGAAWEQVSVEPAPFAPGHYDNPFYDARLTAGASSIRAFEQPLREAGALARSLLVREAAARWGVPASQCIVGGGTVRHGSNVLQFGQLAEGAASRSGFGSVGKLSGRLVGKPLPRLDGPAKAGGTLRFAGDVRLSDMVFASARLAPANGRLMGFDRAAAKAAHGDAQIMSGEDWVAGVGSSWWKAEQALAASAPVFEGPANASLKRIDALLSAALDAEDGTSVVSRGDVEDAFGSAEPLRADYRIAPSPRLGLEPTTVAARFSGNRLEIWAATQSYDHAVAVAAEAANRSTSSILFYPLPVGSPNGAALETVALGIAIDLAKRLKKPVSLTLSASTTQNQQHPGPPMAARMAAVPAPSGGLKALRAHFVSAPGIEADLARIKGEGSPRLSLDGAEPPYGIPALDVSVTQADLPFECGYLRGGNAALTAFAHECFIDETAKQLGREPIAFRMAMLEGNPRLANVLMTASRLAGWDGGAPGSSMGLACASAFGSHIALVAQAVLGERQEIMVEKLVAVVDCGRAINPGLVQQQVEGSLLDALALATVRPPEFVAGMVKGRGPGRHGLMRALEFPDVIIELVSGKKEPGGVSGLGHLVLPAAVSNSLAARTGLRLRNLPFDPMAA